MAGQLTADAQIDLSGGENTVTNPFDLGAKQSQQCINLLMDEHGSHRTRDGTLIQTTSPDATRPIVKLYDYVKVDGTILKLAILKGTTGNNTLYQRDTTPWTAQGGFGSVYAIPDAVTFTNLAIFAPGQIETIKSFNGTNFNNLTGAPNAAHIAVHLGYLWAWNTNASTTATAGPSSLSSSDVNNPNSWPGANQVFISKDDGQSGQGIGLFTIAETGISPTATLIVFKDFSGYEVSGVFGSSNFAVQKIKSDMGCIAPRTIQFVSGFGLIRLTHKGFALFDGVNDTLISEEERPRIFGRDNFTGLDWTNVSLSVATQSQNPPLYVCACPVSGTALTRVFIYDLVRRSWSICQFANSLSTLQLILNPNQLPLVLGGDASAGQVRRYFAGDTTDDGTAIAWQLRTKPSFSQSPSDRSYFRRLLVKFYNIAAGATVTAKFVWGPSGAAENTKSITKTIPTITPLNPSTGYGVDAYGSSVYGGVAISAPLTDVDLDYGIGRIANWMFADVSGTGMMRLRNVEWHRRKKPLTRSAVA